MPRAKPPFMPEPRIWNARQVATRLGKGENWFSERRKALESEGFPRHDDFLGGWDSTAIEAWLDKRAGLGPTIQQDNPWDRLSHGKRHAAVS